MKTLKLFSAVAICSATIFFAACSDDSSSSPSALQPESSSSVVTPGASEIGNSNGENQISESSSSVVIPQSSAGENNGDIQSAYGIDADGFATVVDVYKNLKKDEKVVFVLRHAERESGLGFESPLTEVGVQQSIDLGKLMASDEKFAYASSGFVRTTNTCKNIAVGRGEGDIDVKVLENLGGNWFVAIEDLEAKAKTKGGTPTVVAKWIYKGMNAEWFYEFEPRAREFLDYIVTEAALRVNVFVTHDLLVMPLVAYASNKAIDMQIYKSKRWLNFLAGVAVIVAADGSYSIVPVKGTESGIQ